jgi:hypothetical protein
MKYVLEQTIEPLGSIPHEVNSQEYGYVATKTGDWI